MAESSATRLLQFLPFSYKELGLQARISRCVLDGADRPAAAIDEERHLVSLVGQRFQRVAVDVSVTVAATLLAAVLAPSERAAPPVQVVAIVACPASRCRRSVALTMEAASRALWTGRIELARDEIVGAAEISILLVRVAAAAQAGASAGYAVERGARLASARAWEIRVDSNASPRGEYLDIREVDFAEEGLLQFPQPEALYQLQCEGENVVLWLNLAKTRVANVLHSDGNVGRRARLRDAIYDRIYCAVWPRLFVRAVHEVVQLGDSSYPWQTAVLQKWLPGLYPDRSDHESRLEALRVEAKDGDLGEILGRLDLLIQVENEVSRIHDMLVLEVEP
jgi:hypothetical protein